MHRKELVQNPMSKDYNFQVHTNIMRALKRSNEIIPNSNFTTLDGNILCMIKSFSDSGYPFFMSDKEIADNNNTSEKTVQRSIKRLCEAGLLVNKRDGPRKRYLEYQPNAMQKLMDLH